MEVKQISARDTYPIRHKILRPGREFETCIFEGDDDEQTIHLGAFVEGRLVSVASLYYEKNPLFEGENHFQLRGMATLEEFQRKGFSRELLKVAFPIIKQNFCNLVWCNARVEARPFYEKLGFESFGEIFEIPDVGPHILMSKVIA
ncbi:GNAT family N-acetyltransferase [Bacteriovorax sp. Seq25_V]|uniref:GNAT family N-acetyltransferase n=1 Tax=Bacteriovorax sp. Seq25_V TaxID=1201288 RepID=UPI00038A180F|nr:GNAT family N-acetyltransferase [Bacteriovorax sp. Seq25_V]EQC46047.1 FR47-like protein [Bacteriovorax sp. Seq25_V]